MDWKAFQSCQDWVHSLHHTTKRINVGPWITVGHGKFGRKLWKNEKIYIFDFFILKSINVRAFNKTVGPRKKSRINKPTSFPESRVTNLALFKCFFVGKQKKGLYLCTW